MKNFIMSWKIFLWTILPISINLFLVLLVICSIMSKPPRIEVGKLLYVVYFHYVIPGIVTCLRIRHYVPEKGSTNYTVYFHHGIPGIDGIPGIVICSRMLSCTRKEFHKYYCLFSSLIPTGNIMCHMSEWEHSPPTMKVYFYHLSSIIVRHRLYTFQISMTQSGYVSYC